MKKRSGFLVLTAAMAAMVAAACSKPPDVVAASPVASTAADNVSDIDVTEHVKTALHQSELLKGFDISVVTLKGDVRLMGVLNTQAQVDEALQLARTAVGAHAIHNELTLKR